MDTPTFVLVAIVLLTFAVFGPKPSFRRERRPKPLKVKRVERASTLLPIALANRHSLYPAQRAAARAPSPLQTRAASAADRPAPQFAAANQDASGNSQDAPLPHEFPR